MYQSIDQRAHCTDKYGVTGVVVMVVQPDERNSYDQRGLEYALWERHHIPMLRKSMHDIQTSAVFRDDKALVIEGQEVCCCCNIVYC